MNRCAGATVIGLLQACLLQASVLAPAAPVQAAAFQQATIKRVVDGREVYIDGKAARVNEVARAGQQVRTGKSRAELLFDDRATGFLGRSSVITLGNACFRLSKGAVLVSGPQKACLGTKVLGVKGTTFVLTRADDGLFDFVVLEGQGYVGPEDGYEEQQESSSSPSGAAAAGDPSGNTTYVCSCEVARFTADGEFVSQGKLSRSQYEAILSRHTTGQSDLPKGVEIKDAFSKCYSAS
jgi:hypothetical protein